MSTPKVFWFLTLFLSFTFAVMAESESPTTYFDDWTLYATIKGKKTALSAVAAQSDFKPSQTRYAEYDAKGRLISFFQNEGDPGTALWFSYDNEGRVTRIAHGFRDAITGTIKGSGAVSFLYNSKGQLISIISGATEIASAKKSRIDATIDARGNSVFEFSYGVGRGLTAVTTMTYSPQIRLLETGYSTINIEGEKTAYNRIVHTYNAAGDRTSTDIELYAVLPEQVAAKASLAYTYQLDPAGNKRQMMVNVVHQNQGMEADDLLVPKVVTFSSVTDRKVLPDAGTVMIMP